MIFLGGIHGVGKTRFCEEIYKRTGIPSYSASRLIAERSNKKFPPNKHIDEIDSNQLILISAIEELKKLSNRFIVDGHFCLLSEAGQITRINKRAFVNINPEGMLVVTEAANIIAERRYARDGVITNISDIVAFQDEEVAYSHELATELDIPIMMISGDNRVEDGCAFLCK